VGEDKIGQKGIGEDRRGEDRSSAAYHSWMMRRDNLNINCV
jgi:hypothetical protein